MTRESSRRAGALLTCLALGAPASALADDPGRMVRAPAWNESSPERTWVPWLRPELQAQLWFTAWDQDESAQADSATYGDPEHDIGFSVPRSRFGFSGGYGVVDFRLRVGTSRPYDAVSPDPPEFSLVDAWGRLTFDTVAGTTSIAFGRVFVPFGRELQMSSNDVVFQERSVAMNWLAPQRDLGVVANHSWRYVGVSAGLFNGGGNLWGDSDDGLMVAARLEAHVGGDTYRTNSTENAFGIGASYLFNDGIADTTHRVGVDMLGRIVGLTLQVEGAMNFITPADKPTVLPPGVPETTQRMGGFAQLSYYVETKVGGVEPAVRIAYYDDATHLQDNGDVAILHGGLMWREPVPFMDFGAYYIHRFELQGRELQNDSVRIVAGVKFPSRKYAPIDVFELVEDLRHRRQQKEAMRDQAAEDEAPAAAEPVATEPAPVEPAPAEPDVAPEAAAE